jgi:hypothetical protein
MFKDKFDIILHNLGQSQIIQVNYIQETYNAIKYKTYMKE